MAGLYSQLFFSDVLTNDTLYTAGPVPPGNVWVVRDIVAVAPVLGPTEGGIGLQVWTEIGNALIASWWPPFTVTGRTYRWHGRQVVNAGDTIQAECIGIDWTLAISGYQLFS